MQIEPRRTPRALALSICGLILTGFCWHTTNAGAKEPQPFSTEFSLQGSDGYRISVVGGDHEVTINVYKKSPEPEQFMEAAYSARAAVSRNGIYADLGTLGEISLRFVPSNKVTTKRRSKLPKGCEASRTIVRRQGAFVGTMHFEGEEGYTAVDATDVSGSIGTPEGILCGTFVNGSEGGKNHRHTHVLPPPHLSITSADNALGFGTALMNGRQNASFFARSTETSGMISIVRWVSVVSSRSDFTFDHLLSVASVTPPPPFLGAATFRRPHQGARPSWAGSLTVSFPGAPEVSLTGPAFTSAILAR
jgi:hypothetical protein